MSLILEALRKSEAERQRGRAPGLFVEQQARRRDTRAMPAWMLYVAGGVLALVLLAWAWREAIRAEGPGAPPTGSAATPAGPDAPPASTPPTGAEAPVATAPVGPVAIPQDPALAPVAVPAAEADPVATVDTRTVDRSPAPPADPTSDPTPDPTTPAPAPAPVPAVTPAVTAPLPGPVAAEPSPAAGPAVAAGEPVETTLPRLADVPASERAGLPALKLSMHVYSDDPARRFVIVDGQRLTEGAAPAPGVVVEQIRRDGAVLSLNGRRVLLGRP